MRRCASSICLNPQGGDMVRKIVAILVCLTASHAAVVAQEKPTAVVFFGVYTQWYGFEKALPGYTLKVCNANSERVEDFPPVKDLLTSRFLVLSDVRGSEFTESQVKLIKSFVERGGGLLVTGGPFTYWLGDFKEKGLAELLPVELTEFDLKWENAGKPFVRAMDSPILEGIPLASPPMVYWIHKVAVKEGAQVVMRAGDDPLLVTGAYGKGKVAVFAGTPMGLPGSGQIPFWEWDGWPKLVQNLATYLAPEGGTQ